MDMHDYTLSSSHPIDMPITKLIKGDNDSKRVSLDCGYESLLFSSSSNSSGFYLNSFCNNNNLNSITLIPPTNNNHSSGTSTNGHSSSSETYSDDSNSVIFSQPSTPIKTSTNVYSCNNSSRTPDHKQELVADVSSFYFASIRAAQSGSAQKYEPSNSHFSNYSASNSNSPIKFNYVAQSPKFIVNKDNYISQRDSLSSKLLRSPAFKVNGLKSSPYYQSNNPFSQQNQVPIIKSFSSRFEAFADSPIVSPENSKKRHTTPTEEEFMNLLFKNKHLPSNPEFLIGRHMGIDQLDIVKELNSRSMNHVLNQIFKYVSFGETPIDLVRAASVNQEWRAILRENKVLNGKRIEFLKAKKLINDTNKENGRLRKKCLVQNAPSIQLNLFKSQMRARLSITSEATTASTDDNATVSNGAFMPINLNCLYYLKSLGEPVNQSRLSNCSNEASSSACANYQSASLKCDDDYDTDEDEIRMLIDEMSSKPPPPPMDKQNSLSLSNEIKSASCGLLKASNSNNNNMMGKSYLEGKFKRISIEDNVASSFNDNINEIFRNKIPKLTQLSHKISPNKKRSPLKRLSPMKRQTSASTKLSQTTKNESIGSKASKKNLKRL